MFRLKSAVINVTKLRNMSTLSPKLDCGPIEQLIRLKITNRLNPTLLKIANDSHKHSHHKAMQTASNIKESHFRVEVVSDSFKGLLMPARHRLIYQLLDDELKHKGLHAIQMKTKTTQEYERAQS